MTPQQQAVAMTNGMIAAAVNGVSNSNPTMQMAMPVTQQQQQQQQQYHQQQLTGSK
jgi:hypothetical protein